MEHFECIDTKSCLRNEPWVSIIVVTQNAKYLCLHDKRLLTLLFYHVDLVFVNKTLVYAKNTSWSKGTKARVRKLMAKHAGSSEYVQLWFLKGVLGWVHVLQATANGLSVKDHITAETDWLSGYWAAEQLYIVTSGAITSTCRGPPAWIHDISTQTSINHTISP